MRAISGGASTESAFTAVALHLRQSALLMVALRAVVWGVPANVEMSTTQNATAAAG